MSCSGCSKIFSSTSLDTVSCNFCEKKFHYDCSSIDRAAINSIKKYSNICYFCNCCKVFIMNNDFNKLVHKIDIITERAAENIDLKKIESEVAVNRKLINQLLNKSGSVTPSEPPYAEVTEVESDPGTIINSRNHKQSVIGTGDPVDSIKPAVCHINNKKYLYISRIDPSVSPETLVGYIRSKLDDCLPDEVDCRLLLAKGRVIDNSITFISFKIGLNDAHFNKLNSSDMWPRGVLIRPFINHSRQPKNRAAVMLQNH